ncbi:MAG TPA: M3 family oligoendopeptidase, partial [Anaerolineales bacterium]|nr:M3 family oligoendopeptidase [Anaerolineales bacterium]HMX74960.1 M3 family oligoendopeptidase [Anaerolineales bacterium]HNB88403.1 M3 family oligoendopeptidase [Anaerolineales bacterium]HNC90966.1 M3 family oligoendopeptidase [Anaerolineales bacterium]HNE68909.1 M3 family oligoendopeptidase [Anaerolineales bacterium]
MAYTQKKWSLAPLYPGYESAELQNAFDMIEEQVTSFEGVRGKLNPEISAEQFMQIVRASEETLRIANKLYSFAGLSFTADTQDQAAQSLQNRAMQFLAEIENRTMFFNLWWKEVDETNARRLMDAAGDYRYYLEALRLFKPHTLTEAEEKIVNIKNVTGSNALINLYDAITNRYTFKMRVGGKEKEMTAAELQSFRYSTDPKVRAESYQEQFRVYGNDGVILGQMYQTRARDWHNENIDMRKFTSPIAARNLNNDIPNEAVDALLNTARKNVKIFQRYFNLKAKHVGMKKLRRYDIYAPVARSKKTYEFDTAADMVLEAFSAFDPKVAELAKRVFDEDRIDSEIRKGKRGGAFCWSVLPEMTPWVLVNYQGTGREVATLAHELGHAIHSMLAAGHNTFSFHSSLPLAETASTFAEMMLIDKMLAEETDESVRRDILFKQMDDAYATILRQSYFALFEKQAHEMVQKNASVDELCAAYMENLKEQFGDSVELSDEFKWEWVGIPHIYHTPFYVYAYAFGQLLVLSLYQQFKAEGESFKPKYLKILSAGGSEAPEKILTEAGVDIRSAKFWQGGFDVLEKLVSELEQLPADKPKVKKAV